MSAALSQLYEPETVKALRRAYNDACAALRLSGRNRQQDRAGSKRVRLARLVLEQGADGECDADEIRVRAVLKLVRCE